MLDTMVDDVERPTVTVVMAAYDAGEFIDEALSSLVHQSLLPDAVILVDDASLDDTAARARRWSDRLPITVVELDVNVGAGAARALAMEQVTSELVCFLDADDVLLPNHLEHLVGQWQRRGGVISPRALVWRPGEQGSDYHRTLGLRLPRRRQLRRLVAENYVFYGALFARADYERVGGLRPKRLIEDWDLWVRLSAAGVRMSLATVATVRYRRHPQNLTQDTGSVDHGRADNAAELRQDHPEWLSDRAWDAAMGHGTAVRRASAGVQRVRRGDLAGVADLARSMTGDWASLFQVARRTGYRAYRAATGRPVTSLR